MLWANLEMTRPSKSTGWILVLSPSVVGSSSIGKDPTMRPRLAGVLPMHLMLRQRMRSSRKLQYSWFAAVYKFCV